MICSTVQISGTSISQLDSGVAVATIPRGEIEKVSLCHDSRSRRPFLRFFAGFVLVVFGLILLTAAFLIAEGGVFLLQMKSVTFGIPVIPIGLWSLVGAGLWLMMGVFRGRYNLLIRTGKGSRKIFFGESTDVREIRDFITRATRELGYDIDASLLDTMHF